MMKKILATLAVIALLACSAAAQAGAGAQAQSSSGTSGSVSTQKPGTEPNANAQAQSNTSASAQAGGTTASLDSGTTIQATLSKSVDAKKAKSGDSVEARTEKDVKSAGKVVIPRGSKLIGHVTEAKASAKGDEQSRLGIAFDKAVLKSGQELALHAVIQTVAAAPQPDMSGDMMTPPEAPQPAASAAAGGMARSNEGVGGVVGSAGQTVGSVGGAAAGTVQGGAQTTTGAVAGNAGAAVNSTARGVVGIRDLRIDSELSNATSGTVFTSPSHNVKLESGTQLILRATGQ